MVYVNVVNENGFYCWVSGDVFPFPYNLTQKMLYGSVALFCQRVQSIVNDYNSLGENKLQIEAKEVSTLDSVL